MPKMRLLALTALLALAFPLVAGAQEKPKPRLELSPCTIPGLDGPARCGTYSVFENRQTRSGRKIDLNVVVLPATGPDKAPDPLFMIAGGPGQGSASLAAQLALGLAPHQDRRDIVLVDQRGTGKSNPLRCDPPEGANLARWHVGLQFDKKHFSECRERLSKQADLSQYTTVQAVEDLDEVRAALGYEKINLMGGSYGSRVVLVYLRQFPRHVRSAMAWSIAPTDMANPLPFARNAQRALEGILSDCEADAACKAAFPRVREQFRQAIARLEAGPIQVMVADPSGEKVSVTVDRGWMGEAVRYAMYSEERARFLPLMIDQAFRGDYAPLVEEGLINRIALGRGLAMGMLMSVVCTEDIPLIRPEDVKTATAGTFLGDYRVRQQVEACRDWPRGTLPAGYSEDVRSDVPVLLLSGELDPATSPIQAESVLSSLSRGRHVVIPDAGHGWWELEGAECVATIIKDFLATADGLKLDTSCISKVHRKPFVIPPTVLRNVSVIDVEQGRALPDMAVELSDGRIQAVVPAAGYQPPSGAKVLDLKGRYVVPGFVEMHAHVFLHPWDEKGEILPRFDRATMLEMLRLMLAQGITTVRDPGAPTEAAVQLRRMIAAGSVTGPDLVTAGRILIGSGFNPEPFAPVKTEQEIREEIRWQAAAGVDFIKVYSSIRPEQLKIAVEEAHAHRLPVIGHLQRTTWTQAAELGIDAVTHGAPWSPEYLSEADRAGYDQTLFGRAYWLQHLDLSSPAVTGMADALARHKVAVDPTLIAMHTKFWGNDDRYLKHPQLGLVPALYRLGWPKGSFTASWTAEQYQQAQAQWPKLLGLAKLLHDRGVLLTVGTDTPTPWIIPGVSFHEEMRLLRDAGIPASDVLRMATLNGARAVGKQGEIGEVKAGMRADLVVLRANPIDKIENTREIEMVFQAGNLHDPAAPPVAPGSQHP